MIPLENLLRFIREDAPWGDVTTDTVVPDVACRAVVRAKDRGTIAGLAEARALFEHFGVTVRERSADGRAVAPGEILLELDGPARAVLLVERTALNIIGRMSGIATRTREAVDMEIGRARRSKRCGRSLRQYGSPRPGRRPRGSGRWIRRRWCLGEATRTASLSQTWS